MVDQTTVSRRVWRWLLVGSLALNIALIGAIAGSALSKGDKRAQPHMAFEFGALARAMDREDRRAIGRAMRRDGVKPMSRPDRKILMSDLAKALRSDPFDQDQVATVLGVFLDGSRRVQDGARAAFVAHLATMPAAQRAALADQLVRE